MAFILHLRRLYWPEGAEDALQKVAAAEAEATPVHLEEAIVSNCVIVRSPLLNNGSSSPEICACVCTLDLFLRGRLLNYPVAWKVQVLTSSPRTVTMGTFSSSVLSYHRYFLTMGTFCCC